MSPFARISAGLIVGLGGFLVIASALQEGEVKKKVANVPREEVREIKRLAPAPMPDPQSTSSTEPKADLAIESEREPEPELLPFERPLGRLGKKFAWNVTKTHWSQSDEKGYSDFVRAIGEAECRSLDECLKSSANIFRHTDPPRAQFFADCADLPYFLRAYYAWKNGLPFSYHSEIAPAGPTADIRFTEAGNVPVERKTAVRRSMTTLVSATAFLRDISRDVSTAMYRIAANHNVQRNFADHYPIRISRESIRPGTVVYDPKGHVAVVYNVDTDGRVLLLQASTNFMVTRTRWGWNYLRAHPDQGAGFKNWRPVRLEGARRLSDGTLVGGRIVAVGNEELPDYSVEQHYGTEPGGNGWSSGRFVYDGRAVDYYEYVRAALSVGTFAYRPGDELRNMMRSLCQVIQDRGEAVRLGVYAGLDRKAHPLRLPDNIYGTYGEWELHSTPSRDARLKTSFKELHDQVALFFDMHERGDSRLDYAGEDLAGDLLAIYEAEATACRVEYTNSADVAVSLTFDDVVDRLFDLSFDPYHCIERRWGARRGHELASCSDDETKSQWYEAEQRLRNQIDRTYDAFMGYTLAELQQHPSGSGVDFPPDVDIRALIESQQPGAVQMADLRRSLTD